MKKSRWKRFLFMFVRPNRKVQKPKSYRSRITRMPMSNHRCVTHNYYLIYQYLPISTHFFKIINGNYAWCMCRF